MFFIALLFFSGVVTGHDPTVCDSGLGQELQNFAHRVGSDQEVFEINRVGSGRIGSLDPGRVGSGPVRRFANLTGQIRSA